jgi:hypothetical protein
VSFTAAVPAKPLCRFGWEVGVPFVTLAMAGRASDLAPPQANRRTPCGKKGRPGRPKLPQVTL